MYTGNNLDNEDKVKLILMLQVGKATKLSHPYRPICRHIIPTLHFIFRKCFGDLFMYFFVNKFITMQLPIKEVWHIPG